jgi:hypothetical protein
MIFFLVIFILILFPNLNNSEVMQQFQIRNVAKDTEKSGRSQIPYLRLSNSPTQNQLRLEPILTLPPEKQYPTLQFNKSLHFFLSFLMAYADTRTTPLSASGFSAILRFSGWVMGVVVYACTNLLDFLESI